MKANIEAMLKDYQESPGAKKDTGLILVAISGDGFVELSLTDMNWQECLGALSIAESICHDNLQSEDDNETQGSTKGKA